MNLLDRLHEFAAKLGFSPKVFDPLVLAVLAIAVNAIAGNPLDLEPLKTAGILVLYTLIGAGAPPALGHRQKPLNERAVVEGRSHRRRR